MPWTPDDAERHTKKADTPARQKLWAAVANHALSIAHQHDLKEPEVRAIQVANGAVERSHKP